METIRVPATCNGKAYRLTPENSRGIAAVTDALTNLRVCESKEAAEALFTTKATPQA